MWARLHATGFEATMWYNIVTLLDWVAWCLSSAGPLRPADHVQTAAVPVDGTHPLNLWARIVAIPTMKDVLERYHVFRIDFRRWVLSGLHSNKLYHTSICIVEPYVHDGLQKCSINKTN